jgi:hypothetical protein
MVQPVERAVFAAGAFVGEQGIDMAGHLDLLAATEATWVIGDDFQPVDDAHPLERGEDLQRPTDMGVRDAVIVQIKAQVRRLARNAAALGRISPRLLSRTSPSWLHDSAQDLADPQKRVRRKARPRVTQQ